jgi:hypothetical protein
MIKKIASTIVLGAGIFVLVCATLKSVFVLVVRSLVNLISPILLTNFCM